MTLELHLRRLLRTFARGEFHHRPVAGENRLRPDYRRESAQRDGLGELNDIAVDEERLAAIGREANTTRAVRRWLSGREVTRAGAAMAVATEAYAELGKVKPFKR